MFNQLKDENKMEQEISFISGSTQYLVFEVLDKRGEPLDLTNSEIKWALSYMGQNSNPILIKDNKLKGGVSISGIGEFTVVLNATDTTMLESSKYEHEPIIIQPSGKILRPAYGLISIKKGSSY